MKSFKVILVAALSIFWAFSAHAQQVPYQKIEAGYHVCELGEDCQYFRDDNQSKYLNAKTLFENGKYRLAMAEFKPLLKASEPHPFISYSMFYYALSAYRLKEYPVARDMFLQLKHRFPKWENIDEVNYWLGNIYLEQNKGRLAESHLQDIKGDSSMQRDMRMMKFHFLYKEPLDTLRNLLKDYPQDKHLAEIVAFKIISQPLGAQDQDYLRELLEEYQLEESRYNAYAANESVKKDTYNIAVFLPFLVDELLPIRRSRSNQFVLDLYEGMEMAQQDLLEDSIFINLYAYDTKKDYNTTADNLQLPEMESMDMIMGPLYPRPSKLALDYSFEKKVNIINPLSSNPAVIELNPFAFLFMPTYLTQAEKAAEFAEQEFENKNAMIVYGNTRQDSAWALTYKSHIEEKGFLVVDMLQTSRENSRELINILNEVEEEDNKPVVIGKEKEKEEEELLIAEDSIGHIFVASSQQLVIASAMSAIEMRGDKIPLIIHENWLDSRLASFEQLERLNIYLMAPTYLDYSKPQVGEFKSQYLQKYKELPTKYSYIGYEAMRFFGEMMTLYGIYFQNQLKYHGTYYPKFFQGIRYDDSQDNQYVPIISFEEGEIKIVNKDLNREY